MRVIFFASALGIASLSAPLHAEQLTVASWNLGNFTGADGAGCNPRTQKDYDSIRRVVNAVDADIWLFQEVDRIGSLARVMDTTEWSIIAESRPGTLAGRQVQIRTKRPHHAEGDHRYQEANPDQGSRRT